MRIIWLLLSLLIFTPVPSTAQTTGLVDPDKSTALTAPDTSLPNQALVFLYVSADRVNVRAGPDTGQRIVTRVSRPLRVNAHQRANGWVRVSGQVEGKPFSGWISADFLSVTAPAAPASLPAEPGVRGVAIPSGSEIAKARQDIIAQSIGGYAGSCPCPYFRDSAGRRCGKRSAWSRPGGYAPLCYESDVTQAHLDSYFARRRFGSR